MSKIISGVTETKLTKFSHDVAASLSLLTGLRRCDIPIHFETPVQRVKVVSLKYILAPKINCLP